MCNILMRSVKYLSAMLSMDIVMFIDMVNRLQYSDGGLYTYTGLSGHSTLLSITVTGESTGNAVGVL